MIAITTIYKQRPWTIDEIRQAMATGEDLYAIRLRQLQERLQRERRREYWELPTTKEQP